MAYIFDLEGQLERIRKAKIYNQKRNKLIKEMREKKDLHLARQPIRTLNTKLKNT